MKFPQFNDRGSLDNPSGIVAITTRHLVKEVVIESRSVAPIPDFAAITEVTAGQAKALVAVMLPLVAGNLAAAKSKKRGGIFDEAGIEKLADDEFNRLFEEQADQVCEIVYRYAAEIVAVLEEKLTAAAAAEPAAKV